MIDEVVIVKNLPEYFSQTSYQDDRIILNNQILFRFQFYAELN
jgi:hypothetical protein